MNKETTNKNGYKSPAKKSEQKSICVVVKTSEAFFTTR